jgi:hypothetical protein
MGDVSETVPFSFVTQSALFKCISHSHRRHLHYHQRAAVVQVEENIGGGTRCTMVKACCLEAMRSVDKCAGAHYTQMLAEEWKRGLKKEKSEYH